jgi:hypothetical protein
MSARNSIAGGIWIIAVLGAFADAQEARVDRSEAQWRALATETFQREFGESVPYPAVHNNSKYADCRGRRHFTSVAYLRVSDLRSDLLILEFNTDGTLNRRLRRRALTPSGRFRVLTFVMSYPETLGPDGERSWRAAQDSINTDHKALAEKHGYPAPLIAFENTNLVVNPAEIDPVKLQDLQKHAEAKGLKAHEFDIYVTLDLNPRNVAGGYARYDLRSVYVGNYGRWTSPLNERWWRAVAATAYHHETGHLWGWEHSWVPACPQPPDVPPHQPFITDPALFGWIDLDGDKIPEINDPNPYGRP